MDGSRPTLWYEDLEGHRQPSLYYLSSEDDPAGPHLICDWNGPPTNFEEFDIDIMSKMIQKKTVEEADDVDRMYDFKVTDLSDKSFETAAAPRSNSTHTILTENDGSSLDFLTVPPIVNSLLRRLLHSHTKKKSPPKPIPEVLEAIPITPATQAPSTPQRKIPQDTAVNNGSPKLFKAKKGRPRKVHVNCTKKAQESC